MEISSIILPAGLSTAAAAAPAPDQTLQGEILLQLSANAHTHLSFRGWSVKNPEEKKKKAAAITGLSSNSLPQENEGRSLIYGGRIPCKHLHS